MNQLNSLWLQPVTSQQKDYVRQALGSVDQGHLTTKADQPGKGPYHVFQLATDFMAGDADRLLAVELGAGYGHVWRIAHCQIKGFWRQYVADGANIALHHMN